MRLAAKAGRKGECGCLGGARGRACEALPPLEPELRCGGSDAVLGRPSADADTRPGAAIEHQTAALAIAKEVGDWRGENSSLGSLGNAHQSLGDHPKSAGVRF